MKSLLVLLEMMGTHVRERTELVGEEGSLFAPVIVFHITELIPLSVMKLSRSGCSSEINACLANYFMF